MTELREAAERLRVNQYTDREEVVHVNFSMQERKDLERVRDAYLAEHAADDDEPLTREWLGSIGGHLEWHPEKVTFRREDALDFGLWSVDDGWKAMGLITEHAASCVVRGLKTRGDFRRLAAALKIPLRTTSPSQQ